VIDNVMCSFGMECLGSDNVFHVWAYHDVRPEVYEAILQADYLEHVFWGLLHRLYEYMIAEGADPTNVRDLTGVVFHHPAYSRDEED
jgi:hypothetical protein